MAQISISKTLGHAPCPPPGLRCTCQDSHKLWPGVAHPTNLQGHHLANQPKLPTPDPIPGRSGRSPSPLHLAKEVLLSVTSPRFLRLPFQVTRSGYNFTTPTPHTQWHLGRGRGPNHTHLSAPNNVAHSIRPGPWRMREVACGLQPPEAPARH